VPVAEELSLTRAAPGELEHGGWRRVEGYPSHDLYVLVDSEAEDGRVRKVIRGVALVGEKFTAGDGMPYIPLGQLERLANKPEDIDRAQFLKELEKLYRRDGEDAEAFADRVAWYYKAFSAFEKYPAKAIADHSKVPVRRVHFWISEARRLGRLPKGQQGKVG
jgi:hypothetical protein